MRTSANVAGFLDVLSSWPLVRTPGATWRRLLDLLRRTGAPMPQVPIVHVVGTCGKGSTATFTASILTQSGRRCGLFTGPHLNSYAERIQVDGVAIPEPSLAEAFVRLAPHAEAMRTGPDGRPTVLETLTAAALGWFEGRTDALVIEAGMGGTRDCTTVLPADVTVMTRIGMDHQEIIGPTLPDIVREKCGAIRPGRPVVVAPQAADVLADIQAAAAAKGSRVVAVPHPTLLRTDLGGTRFVSARGTFRTRLPGRHQSDNAATAMEAALLIDAEAPLQAGILQAVLPGRLERIPGRPPALLDGAHNLDGARSLARFLQEGDVRRPWTLVVGMLADKDRPAMLAELLPGFESVVATLPLSDRSGDPDAWFKLVRSLRPDAAVHKDIVDALAAVPSETGTLVVSGSLYLVGEARMHLLERVVS